MFFKSRKSLIARFVLIMALLGRIFGARAVKPIYVFTHVKERHIYQDPKVSTRYLIMEAQ
jgi:hypothetical protein